MFSATVGQPIQTASSRSHTLSQRRTDRQALPQVARKTLRAGHAFLSTVTEDEQVTHEHVEQSHLTVTYPDMLPTLLGILKAEVQAPDAKIIVYSAIGAGALVTHAAVRYNRIRLSAKNMLILTLRSQLDGLIPGVPLLKIAGKTSQGARDGAIRDMKAAKRAVLFSSDVTARGLDIPDVSLIIQVEAPDNTDTCKSPASTKIG